MQGAFLVSSEYNDLPEHHQSNVNQPTQTLIQSKLLLRDKRSRSSEHSSGTSLLRLALAGAVTAAFPNDTLLPPAIGYIT